MEPFDEHAMRLERLRSLRERGVDPFPATSQRTHVIVDVQAQFTSLPPDEVITIAGRLVARRAHGGSTFGNIDDGSGNMQVYFKQDTIGDEAYALLDLLDVGDFIEVTGSPFTTKKGEATILAAKPAVVLTKALRPLPEKWHGLTDVEVRYRRRYLDLLANASVKQSAVLRAEMVRLLREDFHERGFLEVETPMLQTIPGGATARPFVTHHNVLDIDLYLRVAPELYLKRLLVAGFPKVFEVARCFRNEGMDHGHNPEFTQIELYEAYADYQGLMTTLEQVLTRLVMGLHGSLTIPHGTGTIDFTPPYPRVDWVDALNRASGLSVDDLDDAALRDALLKKGVPVEPHEGRGAMLDGAYKKFVRPTIVQPTFFVDHPLELSPLAKSHPTKPGRVERFQLVLASGVELMNGFSELNDPIDQRRRFEHQEKLRHDGDDEAHRIDEDFIEALEHGMPPAAGVGIGIDRLAGIMANQSSIKEIILFPTLRPERP